MLSFKRAKYYTVCICLSVQTYFLDKIFFPFFSFMVKINIRKKIVVEIPSGLIFAARHLAKRQAWHWFRRDTSTIHFPPSLHVYSRFLLKLNQINWYTSLVHLFYWINLHRNVLFYVFGLCLCLCFQNVTWNR